MKSTNSSVAFDLQKDKKQRDDSFWQPFKVVSMWDMHNFCSAFWLMLLRNVAEADVRYQTRDECRRLITEKLAAGLVSEAVSLFEPPTDSTPNPALGIVGLRDLFAEMGLATTAGVAGDKALKLGHLDSIQTTKLVQIINEIMKVFQSELESKSLFMMKTDRGSYYETKDTILGQAVINKFSSIQVDAEEAGNCFALARYTACVFHLMRIMERLAKTLAQRFRVEPRFRNLKEKAWGKLVEEISDKVKDMKSETLGAC